jgi:hypothetical protein
MPSVEHRETEMTSALWISAAFAALLVAACSGGSAGPEAEVAPVVGVWPATVERQFVDEVVEGEFVDPQFAQCILEHIQQQITLDEFELFLRAEAAGAPDLRYGDIFSDSLIECAIIFQRDVTF